MKKKLKISVSKTENLKQKFYHSELTITIYGYTVTKVIACECV